MTTFRTQAAAAVLAVATALSIVAGMGGLATREFVVAQDRAGVQVAATQVVTVIGHRAA